MRKKILKKAVVAAMSVLMLGSALTVHAEDGVYTVKRGDNLSKIAKEVYGSRAEWKTIYEANKGIIKDANMLYAGQQLVLPGQTIGTETTTETATDTTSVAVDASTFLQSVYGFMAAQDYASMRAIDGSEVANAYVNAMTENHAIYIPDGGLTGTGAGVYKYEGGGYYFYYGDYVDGVKSGNGVWFVSGSDYMDVFTGIWSNDEPNGQGTRSEFHDDGKVVIYSGNLVNGLWNGDVNVAATTNNAQYNMSFTADNGVAADRTEEFFSHLTYYLAEGGTREIFVSENNIIIAFDGELNGVINDDGVEQFLIGGNLMRTTCIPGAHLGVPGWED